MTDRPSAPASPPTPRCSVISEGLDEPVLGTASVVRTWLLLEHPGSWSATALLSRRLPAAIGVELARRANRHRVRVVLIRRPGRTAPDLQLACFAATTGLAGPWLGRATLTRPEEVLDIDLAALATGARTGFERTHEPMLCVCTHGSHDPCCAERGRPVAAALATRFPDATWEVSHIGGDRFAGNVVCFPAGDYLGRLDEATAVPVLEEYVAGRYVLPYLRGRAGFAPVVQAAEILVRERLEITDRRAIQVLSGTRVGDAAEVVLRVDGHGDLTARVRIGAGTERTLTCTTLRRSPPPTYELLGVTARSS